MLLTLGNRKFMIWSEEWTQRENFVTRYVQMYFGCPTTENIITSNIRACRLPSYSMPLPATIFLVSTVPHSAEIQGKMSWKAIYLQSLRVSGWFSIWDARSQNGNSSAFTCLMKGDLNLECTRKGPLNLSTFITEVFKKYSWSFHDFF